MSDITYEWSGLYRDLLDRKIRCPQCQELHDLMVCLDAEGNPVAVGGICPLLPTDERPINFLAIMDTKEANGND